MVNAICKSIVVTAEGDKLASNLLKLYSPLGGSVALINNTVTEEINSTSKKM